MRHYLNLHKTEGRLRALLQDFSFAPIREVFPAINHAYGQGQQSGSVIEKPSSVSVVF
jgi:hypothetical protein